MTADDALPSVTIVIPSHDESGVLARTLDAVARQDYLGEIETVVVANGCSDDTALVSRRYERADDDRGRHHRTIELAAAGKPGALNAGDAAATGQVRVYLDADITISSSAVRELVAALSRSPVQFAVPTLRLGPSKSRLVRSYLAVWSQLPYVQMGASGGGVYAVSAAGRSRWDQYPAIFSDDTFARLHFSDSEIAVVPSATGTVWYPDTASEMVSVRARMFRGVWQLRRDYPGLAPANSGNSRAALGHLAREPRLWVHAPAFLGIYVAGYLIARRRERRGDDTWARAETSRQR